MIFEYFLAGAVFLICIGVLRAAFYYTRLVKKAAVKRATAAELFYSSLKPLLSDDETPSEIVDRIETLNRTINDKSIIKFLFAYLSSGRWREPYDSDFLAWNKVLQEFLESRPELREPYESMVVYWFLAVTYMAPLRGKVIRAAMSSDELPGATNSVKNSRFFNDKNNGDGASLSSKHTAFHAP